MSFPVSKGVLQRCLKAYMARCIRGGQGPWVCSSSPEEAEGRSLVAAAPAAEE